MIAISISSAFDNFCKRWVNHGRDPIMKDEQLTEVIEIPQISSDEEESVMRIWMRNELPGKSVAETFGDYIPQLNDYKIVDRLYEEINNLDCLREFLSALQITEIFRHDTALFLPVLIARKNCYPERDPESWKEFNPKMVKVLNF